MGWVTIVVELVGGLAVLIGPFVLWVSIPLAAILLVSILTLLLPYGFLSIKLRQSPQPGFNWARRVRDRSAVSCLSGGAGSCRHRAAFA